MRVPFTATTPYINTIPPNEQVPYPGDREIERRIKSLVRWNALAMVVRAQSRVGRHRRPHLDLRVGGDAVRSRLQSFLPRQGRRRRRRHHLLPGPRLAGHLRARVPRRPASTEEHLRNFRHELRPGGGLSSYPHPWLMPDFWEFPTVSMGLGPLMAIYQARFTRVPRESRAQAGRPIRRSGRSSATARPTSRKRSARSRSPRARSSTT